MCGGGGGRLALLASSKPLFTWCLHSVKEGGGPFLRHLGLAKRGQKNQGWLLDPRMEGACPGEQLGCRLNPDPMHALHWPRGEPEADVQVGGLCVPAKRGKLLCELRGTDPPGWRNCWSHPLAHRPCSSTPPGSVSPQAPQCMVPPCPWRGQDIERRSTVYTFQNGQPCRMMGESDRVTRQARILPRVLKGDIP